MVNGNGLSKRRLRRLGLQAKTMLEAWLLLHVGGRVLWVLRVVLGLLLGEEEALLEDLNHVVALLLLVHQLLIEDFVHIDDRVFDLGQHLPQLPLKLWQDLAAHRKLELLANNLPHCSVGQPRCRLSRLWNVLRWLAQRLRLCLLHLGEVGLYLG